MNSQKITNLWAVYGYYGGRKRVNLDHRARPCNPRLCGHIGSISLATTEIPVERMIDDDKPGKLQRDGHGFLQT
ncbi:unnamed protein product [Macrosiphum euphorbiae]|uniref:Uncharacterized protein n=1 Tax=Macrosiphum euphorbiae TaxID=13131 RepID=A0AAV0VN92_9HEMI|nr:unnamed protein product [Macrosiphum euphorbiae]